MARRPRFADPVVGFTAADLDQETVNLTALVHAFQKGIHFGPPPAPTPREQEILQLLANDHDIFAIAERLIVERNTVRSHTENMRMKYRRRTMTALVALGLRQRWII